jgi:hypothetical protein
MNDMKIFFFDLDGGAGVGASAGDQCSSTSFVDESRYDNGGTDGDEIGVHRGFERTAGNDVDAPTTC